MTTRRRVNYVTRSRSWCFTINNPDSMEKPMFLPTMKYLVFQLERGENGTIHYQGYVYFKSVRTMRAAKALISVRAHMEAANGSPASNKVYCTKPEGRMSGPWEFGVLPAVETLVALVVKSENFFSDPMKPGVIRNSPPSLTNPRCDLAIAKRLRITVPPLLWLIIFSRRASRLTNALLSALYWNLRLAASLNRLGYLDIAGSTTLGKFFRDTTVAKLEKV